MAALFFASLAALLYIYLGYPLVLFALSRLMGREVRRRACEPSVTVLIAAHNEQEHIGATIANKLSLDFPQDRLEIIVVSDGSEDGTDAIVRSFADRGVRLIRQEPRQGKTAALNLAVPSATGEILVFSDANSLYAPDALKRLVENFADPGVGYVTGKMVYAAPDGSMVGDGCSAYMRYENLLRAWETLSGSIVGVDGGIDAVRSNLYRPMRPDQLPDFVLPLAVAEQGYRVVYEPRALLREDALRGTADEYRMRVRVTLRALWALWDMRGLLNPLRHGLFSFQLFSHKVLRYLAVVFMACAVLCNVVLAARSLVFRLALVLQALFYGLALAGRVCEKRGVSPGLLYVPYYFCLVNVAAGHALVRFLRGEKQVLWKPRTG